MIFRLTDLVLSQLAVVVWSDPASIANPPDQWGVLNFGPGGCAGDCPACQGVCLEDSDCLGDLVCFHRTDSTPIFGCKGGKVIGDVPGYDYCAYAQSTTVCAAKPPLLKINRRRQKGFNLIGCFKQSTEFSSFNYKDNFEVSFTLVKANFLSKCKAECASFCYMAVMGLRCSCSNSPRWVGSEDAVLGTFKCEKTCDVYGGCGGTNTESVWSNGDLKSCAERHTKHWARPLSPGKFCSSTEKKKCRSGGSTSVKTDANDSEKCRDSCEKSVECGGYTFATSGTCTHYAWSNDLKQVASSNGEMSGMCDHASVEEFSLIGCFWQGNIGWAGGPQFLHDSSYQVVFGPQDKDKDVVRKCKIFCHHTCYMAIVRDVCYCSDDPQLGSAFSPHPDILCSSTGGGSGHTCSVKYGCGSGTRSSYQSVYSNNYLKSSKCRGKTVWGKTCSFEVGVDADGFTYRTIKKMSAALCHQECEKDSKCGCFTHMPDMCHLKPKGVSCVLKQYEASCAFTAGTCSIKSENANVEKTKSASVSTEAKNFGVMGKVTIENVAGGSLSAKGTSLKGATSIVSECSSGFSGVCKWEFHKSRLSWDGAVAWDIKAVDKNLFVQVKNSLKGLKDTNKMSLEECKTPSKLCSWVLEPSPHRTGHYYIRPWGGNTYLKKSSDQTARLDACDSKGSDVPECQWKVTGGLNPPKLKNPDAIKPHFRYTVYTRGLKDRTLRGAGNYGGTKMILHNCLKRGPWYDCFLEFVKSEASTGDHPVWYMKTNYPKGTNDVQARYMMMASKTVAKMGTCTPGKDSPYRPRECQWVLEEKEKGKYKIRNLAVEGYLHVEGTVEQIKQKTMPGETTSAYDVKYGACADTAKCTWELSTLGFPSRVALDAMMTVQLSNRGENSAWMLHTWGNYVKVNNKYPDKEQVGKKLTMNLCTSGDKKEWRCMYQFEKSGKKVGHTDIWYIRQWNGYLNDNHQRIGPLMYISVPVDQRKVDGIPKLSMCKKKGDYRPEECQWILEPLEIASEEEDTVFQMRNVAVSNTLSGQNVYLSTQSETVKFRTCSPKTDKKCQWKVNPKQSGIINRNYPGMDGSCLPRKVKPVVGYQAYGTNGLHWSKIGAQACNLKCAGRKDCLGYVVTPGVEADCRLKVQMFGLTPKAKRVANTMIGENLGCGSRQLAAEDSKSKVVPVFDFRLAGCVGLATAPTPVLSNTKKYAPTLLVGACMEFCKDSCGMMVGWKGAKCSCFDTEPVAAGAWPLEKCDKCKPGNGCGANGAASVYVNMQIKDDKCKSVTKPPVDAADRGTKHCSVIVGMRADVDLAQNTAVTLQKNTAEECAKKCESTENCAGYTFDVTKKCYFFKWDVEEWKPVDALKHVTGTCDEKPAEDFTLIGCYKKNDLTTKFVKYSIATNKKQVERCSRWCRDTCYMAIVQSTCACGNDMSSVTVQDDSKCNYAESNCDAVKGGCGGSNHAGVHANNVLRLSSKCSEKKPWRRLCTKERAMKVLGEELKVYSKKTVGWCHQACEKDSQCGCFRWDPAKSGCHLLKTTASATSKKSEQCKIERHEGMFRLVSGICK